MLIRLLTLAVFVNATACSSGVVSIAPAVSKDGSVITVPVEIGITDSGIANGCTYKKEFPAHFWPVTILVLFDRSSSMTRAMGMSTRFETASHFLANLVETYSTKVRWGYADYPGDVGCSEWPVPGCCVAGPSIGVSNANANAVHSAIKSATPRGGSSPLALALELGLKYFESLESDGSPRYVLLATDGEPSCTLASALLPSVQFSPLGSLLPGPCLDAISSISRLVSQGIRVIVFGVGPEESENPDGRPSCLDLLAKAGGMAVLPGQPSYFSTTTADKIEQVIEQALGAGERPSCIIDLNDRPQDFNGAQVFLDGQPISVGSEDGWVVESMGRPARIRILGKSCERLRHFQVKTLEMRYACTTCIESVCP